MIYFWAIITSVVLFYSYISKGDHKTKRRKATLSYLKKKTLNFTFETQKPKINSSLRGISVVDSLTVSSGSNGTYTYAQLMAEKPGLMEK